MIPRSRQYLRPIDGEVRIWLHAVVSRCGHPLEEIAMATEIREVVGNTVIRAFPTTAHRSDVQPAGPAPMRALDMRADGIIGASAAISAVLARARKVAPTESTVLVT